MADALPSKFRTSSSVAVDGTDVETWGALHGDCTTVELDGEAAETQLMEEAPRKRKAVRKARVLGVGADGRKQYTVDRDVRAGHRSATNSRPAGRTSVSSYTCGTDAACAMDRWGRADQAGAEVAGVVTTLSPVPAGTHRGRAIVDELLAVAASRPCLETGHPSLTGHGVSVGWGQRMPSSRPTERSVTASYELVASMRRLKLSA